ncbi:MAG: hypothetical protein JXR41_00580, partial [Bacteroidales bacterium]|nr:hypothetical protein [Bacteroidales bacterium]
NLAETLVPFYSGEDAAVLSMAEHFLDQGNIVVWSGSRPFESWIDSNGISYSHGVSDHTDRVLNTVNAFPINKGTVPYSNPPAMNFKIAADAPMDLAHFTLSDIENVFGYASISGLATGSWAVDNRHAYAFGQTDSDKIDVFVSKNNSSGAVFASLGTGPMDYNRRVALLKDFFEVWLPAHVQRPDTGYDIAIVASGASGGSGTNYITSTERGEMASALLERLSRHIENYYAPFDDNENGRADEKTFSSDVDPMSRIFLDSFTGDSWVTYSTKEKQKIDEVTYADTYALTPGIRLRAGVIPKNTHPDQDNRLPARLDRNDLNDIVWTPVEQIQIENRFGKALSEIKELKSSGGESLFKRMSRIEWTADSVENIPPDTKHVNGAFLAHGGPVLYPVNFRIRTADTIAELKTKPFTGPNGSSVEWYSRNTWPMDEQRADLMEESKVFVQLQIGLLSDPNRTVSPLLKDFTVVFSDAINYDFLWGQYVDVLNPDVGPKDADGNYPPETAGAYNNYMAYEDGIFSSNNYEFTHEVRMLVEGSKIFAGHRWEFDIDVSNPPAPGETETLSYNDVFTKEAYIDHLRSDVTWKSSVKADEDWASINYNDFYWSYVAVKGDVGIDIWTEKYAIPGTYEENLVINMPHLNKDATPYEVIDYLGGSHEVIMNPRWVWHATSSGDVDTTSYEPRYFRRTFFVNGKPTGGALWITADNSYEVFLNGYSLGGSVENESTTIRSDIAAEKYDLGSYLNQGKNVLAVKAQDNGYSEGLLAYAVVSFGRPRSMVDVVVQDHKAPVVSTILTDIRTDIDMFPDEQHLSFPLINTAKNLNHWPPATDISTLVFNSAVEDENLPAGVTLETIMSSAGLDIRSSRKFYLDRRKFFEKQEFLGGAIEYYYESGGDDVRFLDDVLARDVLIEDTSLGHTIKPGETLNERAAAKGTVDVNGTPVVVNVISGWTGAAEWARKFRDEGCTITAGGRGKPGTVYSVLYTPANNPGQSRHFLKMKYQDKNFGLAFAMKSPMDLGGGNDDDGDWKPPVMTSSFDIDLRSDTGADGVGPNVWLKKDQDFDMSSVVEGTTERNGLIVPYCIITENTGVKYNYFDSKAKIGTYILAERINHKSDSGEGDMLPTKGEPDIDEDPF